MTLDPQRRRALLEAKLAALVRDQAGEGPVVCGPFGDGAALLANGDAWVLVGAPQARALGPALAWARQHQARSLHVVADEDAGHLARRAAAFEEAPTVWQVDERAIVPAVPVPLPVPPPLDPRLEQFIPLIEAGGADPVVEHGVLTGEVAGLEVCRAIVDPHTDAPRLEVGVGAHDREAFQLLHGDVPPVEALAGIVEKVAPHRRPGAAPHPLHRLAAERLLRHRLLGAPELVGAKVLSPAEPPLPRQNLKQIVPCVATGEDEEGRPLVVVCSVGVDLDVVPYATDARLAAGDDHRVVIAVPSRDVHPVTLAIAGRLREPVEVVGVTVPV